MECFEQKKTKSTKPEGRVFNHGFHGCTRMEKRMIFGGLNRRTRRARSQRGDFLPISSVKSVVKKRALLALFPLLPSVQKNTQIRRFFLVNAQSSAILNLLTPNPSQHEKSPRLPGSAVEREPAVSCRHIPGGARTESGIFRPSVSPEPDRLGLAGILVL